MTDEQAKRITNAASELRDAIASAYQDHADLPRIAQVARERCHRIVEEMMEERTVEKLVRANWTAEPIYADGSVGEASYMEPRYKRNPDGSFEV